MLLRVVKILGVSLVALAVLPGVLAQANAWVGRFLPALDPSVSIRDAHFQGPGGELPLRI